MTFKTCEFWSIFIKLLFGAFSDAKLLIFRNSWSGGEETVIEALVAEWKGRAWQS